MNWQLIDILNDMKGSQAKAVLNMYAAGKWLDANELNTLSGMSLKTCKQAVKSEATKQFYNQMIEPRNRQTISELKEIIEQLKNDAILPDNEPQPEAKDG